MRTTIGIAAALSMLLAATAYAHTKMGRSSPVAGSTVTPAPKEVTISFTEALEPKFSTIVVQDSKGVAVHAGKAALAPGNTTQLSIALKPLAPGSYKVIWRVLSVDTHRSQGEFTFRVGP